TRTPDNDRPAVDLTARTDVRRESPHLTVELDRRPRPVEHAVGAGDLVRVGDALLRLRTVLRPLQQRALEQRDAQFQRPRAHGAGVVLRADRDQLLTED